jgi:hypothetical protein
MTLKEQFEKETGLKAEITMLGSPYGSDEYIDWLETKLESYKHHRDIFSERFSKLASEQEDIGPQIQSVINSSCLFDLI